MAAPLCHCGTARRLGGETLRQSGDYRIPGRREAVWAALNDPATLQRCLEGCRSLTPVGEGEFAAELVAKVGPVKAAFTADIHLRDPNPPASYRLDVQVKGGAAGFANGTALVRLEEVGSETQLRYTIEGAIGGKLAQIGARLVEGAARKLTARFFERFAADFAAIERQTAD